MNDKYSEAMKQLLNKEYQSAIGIFRELNLHSPKNIYILTGLAQSYLGGKFFNEAITSFSTIAELDPSSINVWKNLGYLYYQKEQLDLAEQCFRKVTSLDKLHYQAWHFLCVILYQNERYDELAECKINAENTDPFAKYINEAQHAMSTGDNNKAKIISEQILTEHNHHPQALYIIALLVAQQGGIEQAMALTERGLTYAPYDEQLRSALSQMLAQLRLYKQAIIESSKLVKQCPHKQSYWLLQADHLVNIGQYKQALSAFDWAETLTEDDISITLQKAHIYKILGDYDNSIALYKRCIKHKDTQGSAYWALANISNYYITDNDIMNLEDMLLDPSLSSEQVCQANFALAKSYEDKKEYELAFSHYQSANLSRPQVNFNPKEYQTKCDAVIQTFSKESFIKRADKQRRKCTPIFIVGLPRSGSTLVEQILASHSQVEGTMELKVIPAIARQVFLLSCQKNKDSSGDLSLITTDELNIFGEKYIQETEIYRTNKPYFIDKLPPNFQHIGLIKMILPDAIIIDARRQPMSCGFGIYKQYFGNGHDFSYSLQHIAFYYQQYLRLMTHWQLVFPGEIFLCQYEKLVENTEQQVKNLLKFCGLPFEKSCLSFYDNKRAVRTASSEQVRKPINRKGIELWKNYEQQLWPLKDALGDDVLQKYDN